MKILITGSNGFIGSHVCAWFQRQGDYVIGLGRHKNSLTPVNEYVCCDLNTDNTAHIFEHTSIPTVDAVIHLAADMRHEPYAVQVVSANCCGTQRLLELCHEKKISSFIQLSSLPVIGAPRCHPITEDHPLAPPTVYHVTKRTQELLADYACYTFGLRTVSLRISAPVGIGMNPKTIVPVFVNRALRGEDLILSGKGTRRQAYIHVNDIAQAIEKSIHSAAHGVYNLSSTNILSNYELAEKCVSIAQSSSNITFSGQDDPMDDYLWDVSLAKLTKDTGYTPAVSMDEAIRELCDFIKQNKRKES